jgi:hypothetical protein
MFHVYYTDTCLERVGMSHQDFEATIHPKKKVIQPSTVVFSEQYLQASPLATDDTAYIIIMALLLSVGLLLLWSHAITAARHPAFLLYPSNKKSVATTCILSAKPKGAKGGDASTPSSFRYGAMLQLERRQILTPLLLFSTPVVLCRPPSAAALTVEQAETSYDQYAKNYNDLDGGVASNMLGIDEARSVLFRQAKGRVLEVACGTGLNLDKYDPSKIRSLTLVDVSQGMLEEAQKRILSLNGFAGIPVEFIKADATSELYQRFGERSFDTVVDSFSLCVMGTVGAKHCLDQMRQVVKTRKDGGRFSCCVASVTDY